MKINPLDLKIDLYKKNYFDENPVGIRIKHLPSGFVVSVNKHKNPFLNKKEAIKKLEKQLNIN